MRPKDDQSEDNMAEVGVAVPPAVVELLGLILHKFITTYVHEVRFVICPKRNYYVSISRYPFVCNTHTHIHTHTQTHTTNYVRTYFIVTHTWLI